MLILFLAGDNVYEYLLSFYDSFTELLYLSLGVCAPHWLKGLLIASHIYRGSRDWITTTWCAPIMRPLIVSDRAGRDLMDRLHWQHWQGSSPRSPRPPQAHTLPVFRVSLLTFRQRRREWSGVSLTETTVKRMSRRFLDSVVGGSNRATWLLPAGYYHRWGVNMQMPSFQAGRECTRRWCASRLSVGSN